MGSNHGTVQIWDVNRKKQIRDMGGHRSRVGALAWNTHLLSSGSRDKVVSQKTKYKTKGKKHAYSKKVN